MELGGGAPTDWFLPGDERGNPATGLRPWTEGNAGRVLVHGKEYFRRLHEVLTSLGAGDRIHFTDWRGDPDECLDGPGTEVARVLAAAAGRGVEVRGLIWRSHPDEAHFSEEENLHLAETVNEAGGEVLLDERVRRGGSHHQKLFVLRRQASEGDDVAFVGGIDLCHGRADDAGHQGDEQAIDVDPAYGPRPPWHDVQLELRGPAVNDLALTFRERWEDPTRLDSGAPWSRRLARLAREPKHPQPMPPMPPDPPPAGSLAVQVLRTYPRKRPPYPFAPDGERSIARAYHRAFTHAERLIYVEDQYLWSDDVADVLASALERAPSLRLVAVVPRHPDRNGAITGPPYRIGQQRALERVVAAGGDRVAVYDLEATTGWPVYVHAKVCVVDDVWTVIGSDNLNRRSWTHDSELSCAVVDADGTFARDTRLRLWGEHTGRGDVGVDDDLADLDRGVEVLRASALALEGWHATGCQGPRPPGHLRIHRPQPVGPLASWWAWPLYRAVVDPDGRPRRLRRGGGL